MNEYEEKQEARRERYLDRADKAEAESNRRFRQVDELARVVDGQPILIGHHSEKRARRDQQRMHEWMRKGIDESKAADELRRRASSVGTGGVSSDDPDAIEKIRYRVETLKARQERMKAINSAHGRFVKACAKTDSINVDPKVAAFLALQAEGFTEQEQIAISTYKPAYSWEPHPFAPYQFQNNGANIRRLEQRIEQLEKASTRETKEVEPVEGLRIVQNVEDNRVQIFFPGKPAEEIRRELKHRGFRWSPMAGAWQRHLNNGGIYSAQSFAEWFKARA